MTIEEAIAHCEGRALADCSECAAEHRQLAEWLTELKKCKWIPVAERLPAPNDRVLMYRPCMENAETGAISVQWGWAYSDASHWMPVPRAPEN